MALSINFHQSERAFEMHAILLSIRIQWKLQRGGGVFFRCEVTIKMEVILEV